MKSRLWIVPKRLVLFLYQNLVLMKGGFEYVHVSVPYTNTTRTNLTSLEFIYLFFRMLRNILSTKLISARVRIFKSSICIPLKILHQIPPFQKVLEIIHKDTKAYSKTIGTPHHNCQLLFMIINIFYHMKPVWWITLNTQSTKLSW